MRKLLRGVNVIELLVFIAVIGSIATISVVGFMRYQAELRDTQQISRATIITEALEKYYNTHGKYPSCAAMTSSSAIITETILPGLDPSVLRSPQALTDETNSINICTDLSTTTLADSFAYIGDGSSGCRGSQSCLQFTLQYKEETTGKIKSINSRHTTNIARSGTITNLTATATSFGAVDIFWATVSDATSYSLQRSSTRADFPNDTNLVTTSTPETSAHITGLTPGATYYFRVTPNTTKNHGNWSNTATVTTPHIGTPGLANASDSPTNPTSQLDFSWTAVAHATSYTVEYSRSIAFTAPTTRTGITNTSLSVTGLSVGTTLFFRVKAIAPDDSSSFSTSDSAITIVPTPTGLSTNVLSATSIRLNWDAVTSATSYTVQCSTDNISWSGCTQSGVNGTNHTFTGLIQGKRHYFRVFASQGVSSSTAAASVNNITRVNRPAAPSVIAIRPNAGRSSNAADWLPGTIFQSGAGTYHYVVGTAILTCPSGTYPVYNVTASYNIKPTSVPQSYSVGPTTTPIWYVVQPTSGHRITYYSNGYCQGSDATSGTSETMSDTVTIP